MVQGISDSKRMEHAKKVQTC